MPAWFNDVTKIMKRNEFNKCIGEVSFRTDECNILNGAGKLLSKTDGKRSYFCTLNFLVAIDLSEITFSKYIPLAKLFNCI